MRRYLPVSYTHLIERDGKYLWHKYALDFPYRYTTGDDVKVESSETGELAAEMFTNFKDAAFVYGYYGNWEWSVSYTHLVFASLCQDCGCVGIIEFNNKYKV